MTLFFHELQYSRDFATSFTAGMVGEGGGPTSIRILMSSLRRWGENEEESLTMAKVELRQMY